MAGPFDYSRVIHETCPLCGHDVAGIPVDHLAPALTDGARRWHEFMTTVADHPGGSEALIAVPQPDVWSGIEYACHVRDVLSLFARRIELALLSDDPVFELWDHDAAAVDQHYREQDSRAVVDDLVEGAAELAALIRRLKPGQRMRSGIRSGVRLSVEGMVRYSLHEMEHHLDDAQRCVPPPTP